MHHIPEEWVDEIFQQIGVDEVDASLTGCIHIQMQWQFLLVQTQMRLNGPQVST